MSDISLGSLTLPEPEAGGFAELIMLQENIITYIKLSTQGLKENRVSIYAVTNTMCRTD
jgi:hypothetical protein